MPNVITDHLDIWTTAHKQKKAVGRGRAKKDEVYGIKKLRELILELAVRGKLAPQDANDEPASVLLERIAKEKQQLIEEGCIRKKKSFPEIKNKEKSFDLPNSWLWIRIDEVGHNWGQKKPDSDFTYIDVSSIDSAKGVVSSPNKLSVEKAPSRARKIVKKGTVIYSTIRPYLQNICIIDKDFDPKPIASTAFAILHPFQKMPSRYFTIFLRSPVFVKYVESVQAGIAYPAINDKQFFGGIMPIPPLAEQHRIVAKVDELMALCDQLEQQQIDHQTTHQLLVETLLNDLIDVAKTESTRQTTDKAITQYSCADYFNQLIVEHFETLFTTEKSIEHLKQTILQLAVMGKLVPQDPNDEPASVLLEKIAQEKAKLLKEGKIKKQKVLPEIGKNEKPFELPTNWKFVRLNELTLKSEAGWSPKCASTPKDGSNWGVLKVSAITWGNFNAIENKQLPAHLNARPEIEVKSGDFLISRANTAELVARAVVVQQNVPKKLMMSDKIIRFTFSDHVDSNYINLVNNSNFSRIYYRKVAGGTSSSMKNVSQNKIRGLLIAFPPLKEQYRIVKKVNELLALCDSLKTNLNQAQTLKTQLADTLVKQAAD